MKARYFFIVLTVLAVSIVSCAREDSTDTAIEGPVLTFTAIHADSKDTKTALQDNGTSIWWTSNEQINIFYGTKFKGQFSSGNSEPQATTTFSGSLTVVTGSIESGVADAYWAVYPYSEDNTCDGEGVTLTVPSSQTGVAGTFADNFFPAIATSTTLDLAFYNVCGGARFSVSQTGITSIKVSSKNATPIAGNVRVGFGANGKPEVKEVLAGESEVTLAAPAGGFVPGEYYYAALLPGTHSDGLDLTFEKDDNTMGTYQISKNLEVHRAVFGKLSNLDEGLNFGPNPKATIQFEDPIAKYACVEKFDTNGDGEVSYEEAAAATSLEGLFTNWNTVTRFDEIKYFTGTSSTIGVFDGCAKLENITIPDNITTLGSFKNCRSLMKVVLPEGLTSLPAYCFKGCSMLTSVTLPIGITLIPSYCFQNCTSLTTLELPSGVSAINQYAFSGCSALQSIDLPAGLKAIGNYAFENCITLTAVDFPATLSSFGNYAFSCCYALMSVKLPPAMEIIPEGLFEYCHSISSISWPNNIKTIKWKAFYECGFSNNNYTLELPTTVTSIESFAFYGVIHHLLIPSTSFVSISGEAFLKSFTYLYVPAGMVDMYKVRSNWSEYSNYIRPLEDYPIELSVSGTVGEAVDLGLSVKWASWNVGASAPEEYGSYFAWGETDVKWCYEWSNYKFGTNETGPLSKYHKSTDNKTTLELEDDAANANWGSEWRIPTAYEWRVLSNSDNCTWSWTENYEGKGVSGYIITSKVSGYEGNSIFLPAAGFRQGAILSGPGRGCYWSSSLYSGATSLNQANYFNFKSSRFEVDNTTRQYGSTIRPVCPKD